jgi:hypothetical protein
LTHGHLKIGKLSHPTLRRRWDFRNFSESMGWRRVVEYCGGIFSLSNRWNHLFIPIKIGSKNFGEHLTNPTT